MATLSSPSTERLCKIELQYAVGRVHACTKGACPFWEPGGAALEGRCAVDDLDLTGRPDLVAWLLRLRTELEEAESVEHEVEARRRFYELLNTGDIDGG